MLLHSHLGDPERKCLSPAQFRELSQRVQAAALPTQQRSLEYRDLTALGYSPAMARQIVSLLDEEYRLDRYLHQAQSLGIGVLTRLSPDYPSILRAKLGPDAPVCLWYRGDLSILDANRVALVGNRTLRPEPADFARQVGLQAARQGYALVSGNARGTDRTGQTGCLDAGGQIIRVLADDLTGHRRKDHVLSFSEDSYDLPFSSIRALSRNRIIHCLADLVVVAQCDEPRGGTWDGTCRNLRKGWSRVCCMNEQTPGITALLNHGAQAISPAELDDLSQLCHSDPAVSLFSPDFPIFC